MNEQAVTVCCHSQSKVKEIAEKVGVSAPYVSQLVAKYFAGGIEAIAGNHYGGNRRNMSVEEEEAILKPFYERAENGEIIERGDHEALLENQGRYYELCTGKAKLS